MDYLESLVTNENGVAMTTSLKIAEVFGKEHKDVLRKIKEKSSLFTERNFTLSEYEDSTGRKLPTYLLDRDFTTFLIMGFTGSKADKFKLDYIAAFNAMEQAIKELKDGFDARSMAILGIVNAKSEIERADAIVKFENVISTPLLETIEIQKPKAEYFDELVDMEHLTNIRDTAKELHIRQKDFVSWLIDNKFLYRDKSGTLKPYSAKMKYFSQKDYKNSDNSFSGTQTLITPEGKSYFLKKCSGLKRTS